MLEIHKLREVALEEGLSAEGSAGRQRTAGGDLAELPTGRHLVTDLKAAVRTENRVNVFIDGRYDFSLDVAQVVELGVKIGREISEAELMKFREASEFGKIYQRALEWVLVRPRSERETLEYLRRRAAKRRAENLVRERNRERVKAEKNRDLGAATGTRSGGNSKKFRLATKELPEISEEQNERVLTRLIERGYVSDSKFAEYYVENRFLKKGISRRRMEMELTKKGISKEIVAEVLGGRDDREEIRKIIARKKNKYDTEKMKQYLARQGFSYDLIKEMVEAEFSEKDETSALKITANGGKF